MRFGKINTIWDVYERFYEAEDISTLLDIEDVNKGISLITEVKETMLSSNYFDEFKYIEIQDIYEDYLIQHNHLFAMKLHEVGDIASRLNGDLLTLRGDYSMQMCELENTVDENGVLIVENIELNKEIDDLRFKLFSCEEKLKNKICLIDWFNKLFH